MPTVLRVGPYRFFFYSNENSEPAHIHVDGNGFSAKFWLAKVLLARNDGFSASDLRKIQTIIEDNRSILLTAYNEFHG